MTTECARESDVVEAIAAGRWPDAVDAELRTHVQGCDLCAQIAVVTAVLRDDYERACREAPLPSSGQVWWRAAVRARAEAQQRAARPIVIVQRIAGACTAGVTCAAITWVAPMLPVTHVTVLSAWLAEVSKNVQMGTASGATTTGFALAQTLSLVLGLTACAIVAPVALYLLLSDD